MVILTGLNITLEAI